MFSDSLNCGFPWYLFSCSLPPLYLLFSVLAFSSHEGSLPPEVLVDEDKEEEVTLSAQLRELVETKQAESIQ